MFPDRLAIAAQGDELTYAQLDLKARNIARALRSIGVDRGDRVAFLLGNGTAFPELFQALMKIGAVAVPLNKRLLADDLAFMIDLVNAAVLVLDPDMEDIVSEAVNISSFAGTLVTCGNKSTLHALSWDELTELVNESFDILSGYTSMDDESLILFTSGTTGRSKAVVRTADMVSMLATVQLVEGHSHRIDVEILYTQAPLYHMGGLCAMLKSCASGGSLVLESHFDPPIVFDLIERYAVNQLYMIPPALFSQLFSASELRGRAFPTVLEAHCAGGRMRDCDREAVFSMFPQARIRTSFGSSESGMTCASYFTDAQYRERPERGITVGTANAFVIMKLIDESGDPVPPGMPGEALVKSPMVFAGYLEQPEATKQAFNKEGFYHTGDMLYLDEEGCFVFVDRKADIVKTGGENVFANEVEQVVLQYPGIKDCAVVGVEDDRYGEGVAAAIVLEPSTAPSFRPEALTAFCKQHMASFKKPRYLAIMDKIPRNDLGKVQKEELRSRKDEFHPLTL